MKISSLDAISIKKESAKLIKVNTEIREGQAVFIVAQEKFPKAVTKLKNTKYDCFYEDSRIDLFLLELQNYDAEQSLLLKSNVTQFFSQSGEIPGVVFCIA